MISGHYGRSCGILCLNFRRAVMDAEQISGNAAFEFLSHFDYIREAGTGGEEKAAIQLSEQLRGLGLTPETEEFPVSRYQVKRAFFRVTKPFVKEYPVAGLRGTSSCPLQRREFLYVEEGDAVSLSKASGKIILLSHRPTSQEYKRLTASGAAGLVCVCGTPLDEGIARIPQENKISALPSGPLPGVMLHYQDAREIVERGGCEAELLLEFAHTQTRSRNVIARIPGSRNPERIIAITAHYDSVPGSKGAYDNMAGAAIVFSLCRYFVQHPPRCTMEFVFLGAEEIGCLGSRDYLSRRRGILPQYLLDLNVDLAGQTIGGTVLGVTADESLCNVLEACLWSCGLGAKLRHSVWNGDANVFAWNGIPAVTLDRDGFGMHTRHDTMDLISPWALQRDARLLAYLADYFDRSEQALFSREIPPAFMDVLCQRFGTKT